MNKDEIIAATRDWIEKAVIGLNLCPFAKAVYVKEQVRYVVSEAKHLDGLLEDIDREIDFLAAADPQQVDTTLIMHASLLGDFLDFNDFLDIVDEAVSEQGHEGVIQVAAFHPQWQFAETEPDDIGNYTNRAQYRNAAQAGHRRLARARAAGRATRALSRAVASACFNRTRNRCSVRRSAWPSHRSDGAAPTA